MLVTAAVRAERISAEQGIDLRAATKAVEVSDRERHQFLQKFVGKLSSLIRKPGGFDLMEVLLPMLGL